MWIRVLVGVGGDNVNEYIYRPERVLTSKKRNLVNKIVYVGMEFYKKSQ
jgi:hypothetical protein